MKRVPLKGNLYKTMITSEFNALPLDERTRLVFTDGKLIEIYQEQNIRKGFFYKLGGLKIDVIYDLFSLKLLEITAWDTISERKAV